jgi:hypothetical protein
VSCNTKRKRKHSQIVVSEFNGKGKQGKFKGKRKTKENLRSFKSFSVSLGSFCINYVVWWRFEHAVVGNVSGNLEKQSQTKEQSPLVGKLKGNFQLSLSTSPPTFPFIFPFRPPKPAESFH